jgi:ferrous iron transport protein A
MQILLSDLKPGEECIVCNVNCDEETTLRLMEMGLISGTKIRVVKMAPLGDPIEITLRGYHFTLRRHEASGVAVEKAA